jgi:hypothetical protein
MPLEDDVPTGQTQTASPLGNAKWWIVGALAIVVVFFLMKKKGSSSGSTTGQQVGTQSNVDPSTGFPLGSSADVAALRTYGALGGGGRFNMGAYPTAKGGGSGTSVSQVGLGGAYLPPYEPVNSVWIHGLPEPAFPVGPAGQPGPGNSGATGVNQADIMTGSQALTTQSTVPINDKSASHTRVYRVKPGDNLAGIASKFGVAGGTSSLYQHNRHTLGPNPNLLIPGTLIYL